MHYRPSSKRSIAIACLSVMLVDCDHIGWKSLKLIARNISSIPFALRSPNAIHL